MSNKICNCLLIIRLLIKGGTVFLQNVFKMDKQRLDDLITFLGGGSRVCSFIYQPIILLFIGCVFGLLTVDLIVDLVNGQQFWGNSIELAIIVLGFIITAMSINAAFELYFYFFSKGESYTNVFKAQKCGNTFMMTLISLFALYVTVNPSEALTNNIVLLVYGVDVLLCIIATTLYEVFILPHHVVEDIFEELLLNYKFKKKY